MGEVGAFSSLLFSTEARHHLQHLTRHQEGSPEVDGLPVREMELNVNVNSCYDGSEDNTSWNCGGEDATEDPEVPDRSVLVLRAEARDTA